MALNDGINTGLWSWLAMRAMTRGKVFSRTVQTSDKRFDVKTQRDNICQLSPVSG